MGAKKANVSRRLLGVVRGPKLIRHITVDYYEGRSSWLNCLFIGYLVDSAITCTSD